MESVMLIYVVFIHNYNNETVDLQKAFTTYEAAKAYRDEIASENDMNEHYHQVESVEFDNGE